MSTDGIFNIVAFIVGLGIGLFQLYYAQHQFEVQQREKMDELRKILTDIQQRLAIIEVINSERSFDVQNKLISLVAREEAVAEFTEDALKKVRDLVSSELNKAGVQDSVQRTKMLEEKISAVLEKSASSLVDNATRINTDRGAVVERIQQLLTSGKTINETANLLSISTKLIGAILSANNGTKNPVIQGKSITETSKNKTKKPTSSKE